MKSQEIYLVKEEEFKRYNIITKSNNYEIFVNDLKLFKGSDYYEEDNVIEFYEPLFIGDKIVIIHELDDNLKIVTKSPYSKSAIHKLYGTDVKYKFNHKYILSLLVDKKEFKSEFTIKYNPYYTTIDKARLDTGDLLANATDEQIAKIIYYNSKHAYELLGGADFDATEGIPTYAKNYVRYKTDIDLCNAIYLSMSGRTGQFSKKIGDIEIANNFKIPFLEDMLRRFKELLQPNEDLLNGQNLSSVSFVKANSTEYPVPNRGVF